MIMTSQANCFADMLCFSFSFLKSKPSPSLELYPSRGCHSAQRPGTVDSDAHIAAGNEVRASSVDIWVPAQELVHSEGVLVSGDDVPAGISLSDPVEQIA